MFGCRFSCIGLRGWNRGKGGSVKSFMKEYEKINNEYCGQGKHLVDTLSRLHS